MDVKRIFITFLSIFIISIVIGSFIYVDKSLTPTITILAETKAEEIANRVVNKAVGDIVKDKFDYSDLIYTKVDSQGKISMIQSNTVVINKIASNVALQIQNEFKKIKTTTTYIPIGTALKSPMLAKYGPQIKVSIEPIGIVNMDFKTQFESTGINQTRHRIYLEAKTEVNVVVPLTTKTKTVITQVPICETIIVGEVPESYVNVPPEVVPNLFPDGK